VLPIGESEIVNELFPGVEVNKPGVDGFELLDQPLCAFGMGDERCSPNGEIMTDGPAALGKIGLR